MRQIANEFALWFAALQTPAITATAAKKRLQEMTDDEFAVTLAEYNAANAPADIAESGIKHPDTLIVDARIVDITELKGDNEGASAVSIVTASGKPLSFVATNKQVGNADNKGFGLSIGGFANLTLEERVAKKTQYIDKDTNAVKYHEKSGYGFITAKKLDAESFMLAGIMLNANPAVQNALLQVHLAKINAGLVG